MVVDFFPLDKAAQVEGIEKHGASGTKMDIGQFALVRELPEKPLAYTEELGRFPAPDQALKCRLRLAFQFVSVSTHRLPTCARQPATVP